MTSVEGENSKEPRFKNLEFNFSQWNLGGKVIFFSTLIAILSLFFVWIKTDHSEIGFLQGGSLFLAAYIYPFFILAQDKKMNKIIGGASSIFAVVLPIALLIYMSDQLRERITSTAGIGLYIFIFAGILLILGVFKYVPYHRDGDIEEKKKGRGKPCPSCDKPMVYEEGWERWYCENCEEYE